jgi:hypothetical protein
MPFDSRKVPDGRKQRRLSEIEPYKVDLVDRAANKRRFIVFKEDAMSNENMGPELIEGEGGLHTPETASELERAAAALESMTTQIGALVTELQKDTTGAGEPQAVDIEKAGAAAAAFREVAEKALSIAKALEEQGAKMDVKKLNDEAQSLIGVLKGVCEKYPSPGSGDGSYPAPAAKAAAPCAPGDEKDKGKGKKMSPAKQLKSVAQTALALAGECGRGKVAPETIAKVKDLVSTLKTFATDYKVAKSEAAAALPEVMSAEDPDDDKVAEAAVSVLREVAERLGLVSKVADDEETVETLAEPVAAEVGAVLNTVEALGAALPDKIEKAANRFAVTLREVAERALSLSKKAQLSGFNEARAIKEMKAITALLQGLIEKYPGIKKSGDMELADLGSLLSVDRFLADFEEQLAKHKMIKADGQGEPAPAPAQAAAPAEPAPVQAEPAPTAAPVTEPPAAGEPAPVTEPPKDNPNAELLAKMEAMQKQIGELQTLVAKARGTVQAPASTGDEGSTDGGGEVEPPLFPDNFNSPAYREALAKRASASKGN